MSVVLLVEDRENVRANLRGILMDRGLDVIEAEDKSSAIAKFRAHAGVLSGAITDCRLDDEESEKDASGVEVGRVLKRHSPKMPVYCYSAFDVSNLVHDDNPFDFIYDKAAPTRELDISANMSTICEEFSKFDRDRFAHVPDELNSIRAKYSISDDDFLRLVAMTPISSKMQTALTMSHEFQNGGDLDDLGEGVAQVTLLIPDESDETLSKLKQPFSVVHKIINDVHIVEVFGIPSIYSYGETFEEAKHGLVDALASYSHELGEESTSSLDADNLVRLKTFLREIISD